MNSFYNCSIYNWTHPIYLVYTHCIYMMVTFFFFVTGNPIRLCTWEIIVVEAREAASTSGSSKNARVPRNSTALTGSSHRLQGCWLVDLACRSGRKWPGLTNLTTINYIWNENLLKWLTTKFFLLWHRNRFYFQYKNTYQSSSALAYFNFSWILALLPPIQNKRGYGGIKGDSQTRDTL